MKTPSEIEVKEDSDCDTCDSNEIDSLFAKECSLKAETLALSGENEYILTIDATQDATPTVAVGTSGSTTVIYSLNNNQLAKLDTLEIPDSAPIVGVSFAKNDNNLLYTAYATGEVKIWDLRTSKSPVNSFQDSTIKEGEEKKKLTCMDISSNNRLIAAGTELIQGDAYIMFWDVRNVKLLGAYWEAHTDDVTQLRFDDRDVDRLISASTDGLINIYDLKEATEDDALQDSLNTESSVELIEWCDVGGTRGVFCSTHTFDVQFWRLDGAEPYVEFKRSVLGSEIKRKSEEHSYIAGAHTTKEDGVFILVGSNYKSGECLRGLTLEDKSLKPAYNFSENSQRARASFFNPNTNLLFTGGEKGIVNIWKLDTTSSNKKKIKS